MPTPGGPGTDGAGARAGGVPGPVDRESFLDAQRRHRRAGWWFTLWTAVSVALVGIPVSAVVAPILLVLLILGLDLVNLAVDTPDLVGWLAGRGVWNQVPPSGAVLRAVALLLLPGGVLLLLTWLGVRRALRNASAAGSVVTLGARPPRTGDLEEQQVVNVVGELALAAGIPAPGVLLLDADAPNAVAVGTAVDDCVVVVTTGLLKELERDETQGVLAHVVAAAGNGDPRIGLTLMSFFQATGLVGVALRSPGDRDARRVLWRLLRAAARPGRTRDDRLADDLLRMGVQSPQRSPRGLLAALLALPLTIVNWVYESVANGWAYVLVHPFLRRAWVARRYRADAGAVELTRDPDAVAAGVVKLRPVISAGWTGHLFAGGDLPENDPHAAMWPYQPPLGRRLDRLVALGATRPAAPPDREPLGALATALLTPLVAMLMMVPLMCLGVFVVLAVLALGPAVEWLHVLLRDTAG